MTAPCRFIAAAATVESLPKPGFPEIAFAGRSNVGKSSLLNALVGQKNLARTSQTPGRTQELNFFLWDERLVLVDMPGYGYAKVARSKVAGWTALMHDYLRGRANLRRVCVLIDARRGVMPADAPMFDLLDEMAVPAQVVLTKSDELSKDALEKTLAEVGDALKKHPSAMPEVIATSARQGQVAALQAALWPLAKGRE